MKREDEPLTTGDIAGTAHGQRDTRVADEQTSDRDTRPMALFDPDEASGYRTRWEAIQAGFVDEPRVAVEQADGLVAEVMKRLAEGFDSERSSLEEQWDRKEQPSTEDLRVALKRYRAFFERLLSL